MNRGYSKVILGICLSLMLAAPIVIPNVLGSVTYEKIVAVWDQGFDAHIFAKYLFPLGALFLNAHEYIDWQMSRALCWFDRNFGAYVNFEIIGYTTWESTDGYSAGQLLWEAIEETGFDHGLYFNGVKATLLMAFTCQPIKSEAGLCYPYVRGILIYHQDLWSDDNVIMHELSHLWADGLADTPHGACIMSTEQVTIGPFILEPLDPDYGVVLLDTIATGPWVYFTTNWCCECKRLMIEHMGGHYIPPDPITEPVQIDYIAMILFWIAVILGIVGIAFLLIRKFGKGKSLRADNKSAVCLVNLLLLFRPLKYPANLLLQFLHYLLDYDHGILNFLKTMLS